MQDNTLRRPAVWQSLLWKDWKQTEQVAMTVVLGFVGLQLLLLCISLPIREFTLRSEVLGGTWIFAAIAPFVVAIGCSGMLIGHERQTGSWAWSSSLPISWYSALVSKLLVSTLTCVLVGVALSIIPVALFYLGYLSVNLYGQAIAPSEVLAKLTSADLVQIAMPIALLAEALLAFFLASLLFRNTIAGMVAVIGCLLLVQPFLLVFGFLIAKDRISDIAYAVGVGSIFLTSLLGLTAVIFRWRWGSGQSWDLASCASSYFEAPVETQIAFGNNVFSQSVAPHEWRMLWRLALTNGFTLRVTAVLACIAAGLLPGQSSPDGQTASILVLICYFLGISAFEGDQTLGRFRFLADRGASPQKLLISRLVGAAGVALVSILFATTLRFLLVGALPNLLILSFCLTTLSIGALSSLCFRQSMVSTTVGVVVLLIGFLASKGIVDITAQWQVLEQLDLTVEAHRQLMIIPLFALSPLTWMIPIAGIFALTPRWLIQEDSKLHIHYWWIALLAAFLPVLLASIPLILRWLS